MKPGTLVRVVCCIKGHEFEIGDIVKRENSEYDDLNQSLFGFIDETGSLWYMCPDEYEVLK